MLHELPKYNDSPLVVKEITKSYCSKKTREYKDVVSNITFAVDSGTVFGLLGPNGAGKSTLIGVLTGTHAADRGEAYLDGYSLTDESVNALESIGVCPQFDILWEDLSIVEHLYFYSRLKGVSRQFEREAVQASIDLCDLESCKDKPTKKLSGGQKRRLSIAIALVSDPKVVFLDEPTVR